MDQAWPRTRPLYCTVTVPGPGAVVPRSRKGSSRPPYHVYIHEALRSSWLPCIGCGSHSVSLWFVARSTLAESCCSRSFAHCPSSTAVGNRFLQLPRQQTDDCRLYYPLTIPNATNVTRSSGLNYFLGNITSPSHRHTKALPLLSHISFLPSPQDPALFTPYDILSDVRDAYWGVQPTPSSQANLDCG